jgi:hypothetical protein
MAAALVATDAPSGLATRRSHWRAGRGVAVVEEGVNGEIPAHKTGHRLYSRWPVHA